MSNHPHYAVHSGRAYSGFIPIARTSVSLIFFSTCNTCSTVKTCLPSVSSPPDNATPLNVAVSFNPSLRNVGCLWPHPPCPSAFRFVPNIPSTSSRRKSSSARDILISRSSASTDASHTIRLLQTSHTSFSRRFEFFTFCAIWYATSVSSIFNFEQYQHTHSRIFLIFVTNPG
ncbi:hypothetical protein AX774_g2985 [Zancudomyces culisetae]|uniref:Uncharacterized protein n=1 Tax=Zancudomyces culisetae TaxID=1213189 RepID=A0A1R1PRE2_ZANCU|nr:hypothetical protein AX774_g2985 [Zancudomyces culisetae]|eukprot:OMH83514.1 hypothetical protein AX774_g2985 [Zancudomyces culisetae]